MVEFELEEVAKGLPKDSPELAKPLLLSSIKVKAL